MRLKLLRAGMLDRLGEVEFIALSIITTVTGLCLAWLCYLRLAPTNPGNASVLSLLIVIIAAILPDYWLQAQVNERQARIRKALPDAIDLLAVSVEAGSGFDGAMSQIESKFPGPLAQEINHVLEEMRLGRSRAEALRGMAERAGVPELTAFVSSICQADQMGVSIAGILRIQADSAREKRVQQVKEAAQKLPVKMLFPLVFFIFPSIFVVILGPAMIRILEAFSGVSAGR